MVECSVCKAEPCLVTNETVAQAVFEQCAIFLHSADYLQPFFLSNFFDSMRNLLFR